MLISRLIQVPSCFWPFDKAMLDLHLSIGPQADSMHLIF